MFLSNEVVASVNVFGVSAGVLYFLESSPRTLIVSLNDCNMYTFS